MGHAEETSAWARTHAGDIALVVNTHWHSDHVGGNALLQAQGAAIAAGTPEAEAIGRRDPGCCAAEYLDQPVAPYTVDMPLDDGRSFASGTPTGRSSANPGHTPGHLALWQPDERLLVVGDALSDYDVGWVNLALDGPDAATTALASLERLADLASRVILPSHGPIPTDPGPVLAGALRRAQRLVDDPDGAVWYGARRIFAFPLMIRDGIPADAEKAEVSVAITAERRRWLWGASIDETAPSAAIAGFVAALTGPRTAAARRGPRTQHPVPPHLHPEHRLAGAAPADAPGAARRCPAHHAAPGRPTLAPRAGTSKERRY